MKEVDGAGFWHIVELRASGLGSTRSVSCVGAGRL